MKPFWRKSPSVSHRREPFGGILFHRKRGITLELDREAYRLFELCDGSASDVQVKAVLEEEFGRAFRDGALERMRNRLNTLKMILASYEPAVGREHVPSEGWPNRAHLTAPERVHWAVTYRCDLNCRTCYVERDRGQDEMGWEDVRRFIDAVKEMGVFQLAIGGGEPFLRPDLPEIVAYAYEHGLVPNVTTNGLHLGERILRGIQGKIGRVQISFDLEEALDRDRGKGVYREVYSGIQRVRSEGIPFGINLLLTRPTIGRVEERIAFFAHLGARQVTILRPKPSALDTAWCMEAMPTPEQYRDLKGTLDALVRRLPHIAIHVDCALSFLMGDVPPRILAQRGVYGCSAGERFLVVLPNGDVYPCSHYVDAEHRVGNVLRDEFTALWNEAEVLNDFRKFRDHPHFLRTACGQCEVKRACGGCRVLVERATGDFYGADEGCFYCGLRIADCGMKNPKS